MSSGLDFTGQVARVAVPLVGKVIAQVRNNFKMNLKMSKYVGWAKYNIVPADFLKSDFKRKMG